MNCVRCSLSEGGPVASTPPTPLLCRPPLSGAVYKPPIFKTPCVHPPCHRAPSFLARFAFCVCPGGLLLAPLLLSQPPPSPAPPTKKSSSIPPYVPPSAQQIKPVNPIDFASSLRKTCIAQDRPIDAGSFVRLALRGAPASETQRRARRARCGGGDAIFQHTQHVASPIPFH